MKASLILLNALSLVGYLGWLGYHLLRGYGRAFSTAGPVSRTGDLLYVLLGVATVGCLIYSFFAPGGLAKVVASAPLAVSLLAYGYFLYDDYAGRKLALQEEAAQASAREKKLDVISKDYVLKPGAPMSFVKIRNSFLTHDRELNTLVRIQVDDESNITAFPVGRINGDTLETPDTLEALKKLYLNFVDQEGKSIFDRYTLRHRPGQGTQGYHLEKYER